MADEAPSSSAGPKRFYRSAGSELGADGFRLTLDGRHARTPGRATLTLPTQALADAVAAEWNAQVDAVDPRTMPLTRLANSAIDGVSKEVDAVRQDIGRYGRSDLTVYRAAGPATLVAAQAEAWDPVILWAKDTLGARLMLSEGVTYVDQPETSLAAIDCRLADEVSPYRLAALHVLTTLTGSVLIALMHADGRLAVDAAWDAAHVDETFQEAGWGRDIEAEQRRVRRRAEFEAASRFLSLTRS